MMKKQTLSALIVLLLASSSAMASESLVDAEGQTITLEAGHASLAKWILPDTPPAPANNPHYR